MPGDNATKTELAWIQVGKRARDTRYEDDDAVGVIMDLQPREDPPTKHTKVWLRPPSGGCEWVADADEIQPAE